MKIYSKVYLLWMALLILPTIGLTAWSKPNTADCNFNVSELNMHLAKFRAKKENISMFPEAIRSDSLTNPIDKKFGVILLIFESSETKNNLAAASFLNLWQKYKKQFNFVVIDTDKPITYYASLYLKDYWKNERLKVLVFSPSGKIRIQLEDTSDFPKLDQALYNLAFELQSR